MTGQGWTEGDIRSRGYSHIPDEDWNRIFGKKHGNKIRDIPRKRHNKDSPDGWPCSCGKPVDDPIHIPRIE